MKLSRSRWMAVVIALIIAADWFTKALVQARIPELGGRRTLVDGWLSLQHNFNTGIAWGWLQELPGAWRTPLLVVLAMVGLGATVSIIRQSRDRWIHVAGALGNLGDRLLNGGVTDFIYVHFFPYIFNVADIAISIGGVLLAARMLLDAGGRDEQTPTHA